MKKIKTNIISFFAGIASLIPFLGSCPGAACASCGGACVTTVVSIFGISLSGFVATEVFEIIQPILIALSAVLFTVAFYSIYKKPKLNHCESGTCKIHPKSSKKAEFITKAVFWISLIASIVLFAFSIINRNSLNSELKTIPFTSNKSDHAKYNSEVAFFDVDCLFWDDDSKSLTCKSGRVEPISDKIYALHDYAVNQKIPMLFTTCCSANMPDNDDMNSLGMLYIPLDSNEREWKNKINQTQSFYIAKKAFGNPKMNYDKKATNMFKDNKNLRILLDIMGIKKWVVFGDAFELCTLTAIQGLLSNGYQVTVLEDVISSSHSGSIEQRNQILSDLKKKGVIVTNFQDVVNNKK